MAPDDFLELIIDNSLRLLQKIGGPAPTDDARRFLLCVALQETKLEARYQNAPSLDPGPARGVWQFEQGANGVGGVSGVLTHEASRELATATCERLVVVPEAAAVWRALEGSSILACIFARLLMLTDPYPVPVTAADAWTCYAERLWRPGEPHPETWDSNWATAEQAVQAYPYPVG